MSEPDGALTYAGYLRLDLVLSAQEPRSDRHDELLFVVMHQVYELWFKQLLHEFAYLQRSLEAGETAQVLATLRRSLAVLRLALAQFNVLETLTPTQFAGFRGGLSSSSGFQSAQFREIEAVLGRRDDRMVDHYPVGSSERDRIVAATTRPPVFDSFLRYLAERGYELPPEVARRDVAVQAEPSTAVQDLIVRVYRDEGLAVEVCEHLVDMDQGFQEWRRRHAEMVQRVIGGKPGTGGSDGSAYLRSTTGRPAFPDLWAVRNLL